jgi:hypothetical protein
LPCPIGALSVVATTAQVHPSHTLPRTAHDQPRHDNRECDAPDSRPRSAPRRANASGSSTRTAAGSRRRFLPLAASATASGRKGALLTGLATFGIGRAIGSRCTTPAELVAVQGLSGRGRRDLPGNPVDSVDRVHRTLGEGEGDRPVGCAITGHGVAAGPIRFAFSPLSGEQLDAIPYLVGNPDVAGEFTSTIPPRLCTRLPCCDLPRPPGVHVGRTPVMELNRRLPIPANACSTRLRPRRRRSHPIRRSNPCLTLRP